MFEIVRRNKILSMILLIKTYNLFCDIIYKTNDYFNKTYLQFFYITFNKNI